MGGGGKLGEPPLIARNGLMCSRMTFRSMKKLVSIEPKHKILRTKIIYKKNYLPGDSTESWRVSYSAGASVRITGLQPKQSDFSLVAADVSGVHVRKSFLLYAVAGLINHVEDFRASQKNFFLGLNIFENEVTH